ncbi:MAG: hypothetical protein DI555_13880 [Novosphingobium pentaromativorans]|uniref:Uncharacterized protein n=1 Tax=Novosphingobium pentaromativorans TaxID=205844 RepID=A0A2W5QS21_9SPHN|nr:MAG: hypothetical protein DI555_13880 [Novosphingobium pentaromativorans]
MCAMSRRALVLTHEQAGHPFRRSLPSRVFRGARPPAEEAAEDARARTDWQLTGGDWRSFLSAYCVSLAAVAAFII